ncbi:MAG: hypothetical protein M9938_03965 [Solirubrobacterales bacterium]|nr:hypothetical protein [Solirubrobacterales bacterium]
MEATVTAASVSAGTTQVPQHMQALAHANRVRLARAGLKREIGHGRTTAAQVIEDCPWEAESMGLGELLRSQPRWGGTRTRRLLGSTGLTENKRIDALTDRQRSILVSRLRPN